MRPALRFVVLFQSLLKIIRASDIKRLVGTFQYIGEMRHIVIVYPMRYRDYGLGQISILLSHGVYYFKHL